MGKKKQTVGYRYYLGMLSTFCQGPVDKVTHLYWDEDLAWSGDWSSGSITIDKPGLFGGDDKEGGIKGTFDLIRGNQLTQNSYLVSQLGENNVSAFYGTTSIVARRPYLGNSPYLKPMSAVMQAGEWQRPGVPQWNLPMMKIPYDSVYNNAESGTINPYNDDNFREGMDIWIVFPSSISNSGKDNRIALAKAVRTAIIARINGLTNPNTAQTKDVAVGMAYGGFASRYVGGSDRTTYTYTRQHSFYGEADIPDTYTAWRTYNMDLGLISTGIFSFLSSINETASMSYIKNAVDLMGKNATRRAKYRHGVLIYCGETATASTFANIASRYTGSGGTFQFHKLRPKHFQRSKSPYDYFQTRVNAHISKILENGYPTGSDSATVTFSDGINLNSDAADGNKPSQQGYDVNPVHILRECIVNPVIGLGEPGSQIDATKANYAAELLFNERFGISIKWAQEGPVEEFMQTVCDHANITCYVSNLTGLWVIKPIRGDYDKNLIPRLTEEDDILEVESLTRRLPSEGINAVTIKYHDIDRNDSTSLPVYNTAAIQQRDGVIDSTTVVYDGILREDLAAAVGERDLLTLGYPLVTGAIFLDRRSYYFEPGDVFWLDAPSYGVMNEVMRVVDVDYGTDEEHRIKLELSSDIYSLEPQPIEREDPYIPPNISQPPVPMERQLIIETPYYLAAQQLGLATVNASLNSDPDSGGIYVAGPTPAGSLASAQVWSTFLGADLWRQFSTMEFAPSLLTSNALSEDPTEELITYETSWNASDIQVGDVAFLGTEFVRIKSINTVTREVTVARGVFDTVPERHDVDELLILCEGFGGYIDDNYTADMSFEVRLQPFSGNQVLPAEEAPVEMVTLNSRLYRPYPAADLKVNGSYVYDLADWTGVYTLTWVHRNRIQQQHEPQGYTEAGLTPEPGLTYILRIGAYRLDGTALPPVHEENIGLVTTVEVDLADYAMPPLAAKMTVEIVAVRDGYENWSNVQLSYVVPFSQNMGILGFWWDTNDPAFLAPNGDGTGIVENDMDPVRHIQNVFSDLP